jgi:hypothetical protein
MILAVSYEVPYSFEEPISTRDVAVRMLQRHNPLAPRNLMPREVDLHTLIVNPESNSDPVVFEGREVNNILVSVCEAKK